MLQFHWATPFLVAKFHPTGRRFWRWSPPFASNAIERFFVTFGEELLAGR